MEFFQKFPFLLLHLLDPIRGKQKMSTQCEFHEDQKITKILNNFDGTHPINDLNYYYEIIDLMHNYAQFIQTESTANILILLNSINRPSDDLVNYKRFDQLNDEEKLTLKSILGAII